MGSESSFRPQMGAEAAFFCSSAANVRSEGAAAQGDHHPGPRGDLPGLWEVSVASARFSLILACLYSFEVVSSFPQVHLR